MNGKRIVLGIHCGYMHDAGAALVVDGELRAAVSQERMSRTKKDPYFPREAIEKCFEVAGVDVATVSSVALAAEDIQFQPAGFSRTYFRGQGGYFTSHRKRRHLGDILLTVVARQWYALNQWLGRKPFDRLLRRELRKMGIGEAISLDYTDHHTCHAASVYFLSGGVKSDEGYLFVIDSYGDGKSVSAYTFSNGDSFPRRILSMPAAVSPGYMYTSVTEILGMKPHRHEGKVTGLAGYGNPDHLFDRTEKYLKYNADRRQFEVSRAKLPSFTDLWRGRCRRLLGLERIDPHPDLTLMQADFGEASKEDIAAAVQKRLDVEVTAFIRDIVGADTPDAILLAGGVFANVKANALVGKMYPESSLVVHPGMTDEGVAVGAALYGSHRRWGQQRRGNLQHVYYGSHYSEEVIQIFVEGLDHQVFRIVEYETTGREGEAEVARLIDQGKVIGLFQGAMEYGPRALGNRSILADPRDPTVNDWVNKRLSRTEYMPFAPVVLDEYADEVFQIDKNIRYTSKFMTVISDVRKDWIKRIPGVVHVDHTARPQIIDEATNPNYYHIVKAFYERTQIPLIINTSFNAHEEPILEHPEQAIRSLEQGCVDFLFLYPYLISVAKVET